MKAFEGEGIKASQAENQGVGMSALAGLPSYLDLAWVTGLVESIRRHLKLREDQQSGPTEN
ncbi:MAG: hypothetical protein EHM23_13535 [Acidobacteria bacterium]|nr:MAG: hypothetical protein EHM23_13535 [Acidobacteriota bacterium]